MTRDRSTPAESHSTRTRSRRPISAAALTTIRPPAGSYLPELHRLEGELRARSEDPEAEACFERAIAVAQQHRSRWWELRARTSLVEWRRAHGKPVDRGDLAAFVASFAEGADTADLRAARQAAADA